MAPDDQFKSVETRKEKMCMCVYKYPRFFDREKSSSLYERNAYYRSFFPILFSIQCYAANKDTRANAKRKERTNYIHKQHGHTLTDRSELSRKRPRCASTGWQRTINFSFFFFFFSFSFLLPPYFCSSAPSQILPHSISLPRTVPSVTTAHRAPHSPHLTSPHSPPHYSPRLHSPSHPVSHLPLSYRATGAKHIAHFHHAAMYMHVHMYVGEVRTRAGAQDT